MKYASISSKLHHTALYTLFHVDHNGIYTFAFISFPLLHVHHRNIYPDLVGWYNQNFAVVTLYVVGLALLSVHPFKLYVIVYVFAVAVGEYVLAAVTALYVCGVFELLHVLAHVYPFDATAYANAVDHAFINTVFVAVVLDQSLAQSIL
jgi:hypothetical protein